MLNVGKNEAEKAGVKVKILAELLCRVEWRDLWNSGTVKAYASRERW